MRGLGVSQGFTIRQLTGSREWTKAELAADLDDALAGANTFELDENNDRDGLLISSSRMGSTRWP